LWVRGRISEAAESPYEPPTDISKEREGMQHKIISGDNHIDLTYCPTDLWSSQAPDKWKQLVPRVEERNDGQHWFCDNIDRGMWNGVGPGFLPYTKGMFDHIDEMAALGFEWNSYPGAKPRPTTPELRIADLDRDGLDKEIIYGCLMVNDLIDEAEIRNWVNARYNDWAADFAKRSDPNRVFPLAIIPNTDPKVAAAAFGSVFGMMASGKTRLRSERLAKSQAQSL